MWWIMGLALWWISGLVGTILWARDTAWEQTHSRQIKRKFLLWCTFATFLGGFLNLLAYRMGRWNYNDAVRTAQKIAQGQGLSVGDVVCHPKERVGLGYRLTSIEGDVATLCIPAEESKTGEDIVKQYPLSELFKFGVARQQMEEMKGIF